MSEKIIQLNEKVIKELVHGSMEELLKRAEVESL